MKKPFIIIFLLIFLSQTGGYAKELFVDRVLAVVNDEVITQSEFDVHFRPVYEDMMKGPNPAAIQEIEEARKRLLNQIIEDKLVYSEAKKLGVQVEDAEVQAEVEDFKKKYAPQGNFEETLEADGMTLDDLKKRFRERLMIEYLHKWVIRNDIAVTPSEIEEFYQEHKKEFVSKERLEVSVLTILKNPQAVVTGMMDERAKAKAEELAKRLKSGADFSGMAREHSTDAYAKSGGYMGYVSRGDLVSSIEEVVFMLPENTITSVLETEQGYHIFKVGKKISGKELRFEDVEPDIRDHLFREKAHARFTKWMDDLKARSFISIR